MDQMLERLAGKIYYCFLDGYSGYNQIVVNPEHLLAHLAFLLIGKCHLVYVMRQQLSKGVCLLFLQI